MHSCRANDTTAFPNACNNLRTADWIFTKFDNGEFHISIFVQFRQL